MGEIKDLERIYEDKHQRIIPQINYYFKSLKDGELNKRKVPLFGTGGQDKRINLFTNSLEHMGSLNGQEGGILCLNSPSRKTVASGGYDNKIYIWELERMSMICVLSGHRSYVRVLCAPREGILVSGSGDQRLIIWETDMESKWKLRGELEGHTSSINGIIRISNEQIISGEYLGDLRLWDIGQAMCLRHISRTKSNDFLMQMKIYNCYSISALFCCMLQRVALWDLGGSFHSPFEQLDYMDGGWSLGFMQPDILLIGGQRGVFDLMHLYGEGPLLPSIPLLHSKRVILDILVIARNIVVCASEDGTVKVINPLLRRLYFQFKCDREIYSIAKFN